MPAKTTKAAVVRTFQGPLTIEALPAPGPQCAEVLVNIAASGVCHADLRAADDGWPVKPSFPFVPGREGIGVVAAVAVWAHMYGDDAGLA